MTQEQNTTAIYYLKTIDHTFHAILQYYCQ